MSAEVAANIVPLRREPSLFDGLPGAASDLDNWLLLGDLLGDAERNIGWRVGEWWLSFKPAWGDKEAFAQSPEWRASRKPALRTCQNAATTYNAFENSRRREKLSFTHHAEVADLPQDEADTLLDRAEAEGLSTLDLRDIIANRQVFNHRAEGTGDNEWFTPPQYIEAARRVMGTIDLDPASNPVAQKIVGADRFYTKYDDGLTQPWAGTVWLNPPYSQPLIGLFVERLAAEFASGRVSSAIMLTHNYTDTAWFHAAEKGATLICFTRGRVKFIDDDGQECAPTQGQAFFYFGPEDDVFREAFLPFGFIR